jgi:anti-sigma regulatory factor (Ser/Thr protein kinase)
MAAARHETLVIENRLSELSRVERWLAGLLEQWAISPHAAFGVDLVINEVVTNVINYAYPDGAAAEIILSVTDTAKAVDVEIVHGGSAFNPFEALETTTSRDLERAVVGGWGIQLIKCYADGHHYRRVANQNRLRLTILKRRRTPSPP